MATLAGQRAQFTWALNQSNLSTSTPDKPVLLIEIRSDQCRALERAIQATLETRGRKILGGGAEWFKASQDEVLAIYRFIEQPVEEQGVVPGDRRAALVK